MRRARRAREDLGRRRDTETSTLRTGLRRPRGRPVHPVRTSHSESSLAGIIGDAADKLVLFAKLYDIAPDGTRTLVHRLVAPVRVPDVTRSFTVTLPGIVHRYERGHRLRFVIAAADGAYADRGIKPVTVVSAPGTPGWSSSRWPTGDPAGGVVSWRRVAPRSPLSRRGPPRGDTPLHPRGRR